MPYLAGLSAATMGTWASALFRPTGGVAGVVAIAVLAAIDLDSATLAALD